MIKLILFWTRWLKKIHKLVLHSWLGPFMVAFFVILFVLVLQFIAKYTDEIFGKGIESAVIARVFGYAAITLVPLALPLAVLLSSLLTMGNMGERYELAACKSSGISLFKIMRPLTYGALVLTFGGMLFSFYVVPNANLKLYTLIHDLDRVKPSFALKKNHFYGDIDGLVIHVRDINRETDILHKIKIYDHTDKVGNNRVTLADSGIMVPSDASGYLKMSLFHGVIHEDLPKRPGDKADNQYNRFYFDTLEYQVQMAGFNLDESEGSIFAPHQYMKNIQELYHDIDSISDRMASTTQDLSEYMVKYNHLDTVTQVGGQEVREYDESDSVTYEPDGPIDANPEKAVDTWFPMADRGDMYNKAVQQGRAVGNYSTIIAERLDRISLKDRKFRIELHNRYALPISCLVFLFLGAPLGAIIRKGGIGLPVIFSILFFIIFYILMIQGKKFARDEILPVWIGVWLPNLVMTPMAGWFTYSSATDSPILYRAGWWKLQKILWGWIPFLQKKKKNASESVSLEDLIALRERRKDLARRRMEEFQRRKAEGKTGRRRRRQNSNGASDGEEVLSDTSTKP